jgi:hypothetical protein
MKLDGAKDKLEEAQLFLRYLEAAQNGHKVDIPFPYCLSAFLNATYGVREYLKASFVQMTLDQSGIQIQGLNEKEIEQLLREKQNLFYQEVDDWLATLLQDRQTLFRSMREFRNDDAHEKRVKTIVTQKIKPLGFSSLSPYGTVEYGNAFAAQYMMYQQVAASYPEMAETVRNEFLPFGTGAWSYITEHHLEIGKVAQPIVGACKDYVDLLVSLIAHFESVVP